MTKHNLSYSLEVISFLAKERITSASNCVIVVLATTIESPAGNFRAVYYSLVTLSLLLVNF